jgi:predicted XRE-type DNA-binding protein
MTERRGRLGSSFDHFLKEEGLYEEVTAAAVKRLLTRQIAEAMKTGEISKSEMARRMKTSRSQLDRLLDPENTRIQLDTLYKAARAVGRAVRLELV